MTKTTIDGIEVELDDGVTPEEVQSLGGEPRAEDEVDVEALREQAEADADLEHDEDEEYL